MYFHIIHFIAAPSTVVEIGVKKQEYVWTFIVMLAVYFILSLHVISLCLLIESWACPSSEGRQAAIFLTEKKNSIWRLDYLDIVFHENRFVASSVFFLMQGT